MKSDPPPPTYADLAKEVLLHRMKDYSEDNYCAGWLSSLEFLLWDKPDTEDKSPSAQVLGAITPHLRAIAGIAGGWWVYEDETVPGERGPVFISMERWLQILAEREKL